MKIYFCGSIRGGRTDSRLYSELIDHMKKTDTVLTEHIGITDINVRETDAKAEQSIYNRDTGWLKECDVVIAECTSPSLGVGYELAYAEKLNKPVYILYDHSRTQLSAMLKGNPYFHIFTYTKKEEAFDLIDSILKEERNLPR